MLRRRIGKKNRSFYGAQKGELRCRTAWWKKLLRSLVVRQQILLYLLPDGSRVNRLSLGWVLSFSILWALCRHLACRWCPVDGYQWCSGRFYPLAEETSLSWAVHEPCQFVMFPVRMLSVVPLSKLTRISSESEALLCAFFLVTTNVGSLWYWCWETVHLL